MHEKAVVEKRIFKQRPLDPNREARQLAGGHFSWRSSSCNCQLRPKRRDPARRACHAALELDLIALRIRPICSNG